MDRDVTLPELLEAQVRRTPALPAVWYAGQTLTYQELDERANQAAHLLRSRGVGPEVRVGVGMERSLELIVAVLGVIKAGGVYVPIDPAYPPERIAFMLNDAQVTVFLTQSALKESLPATPAQPLCLDQTALLDREPITPVESRLHPDNLAYMIYTSGSTGTPKGVMLSHRALCNRLLWGQELFPTTPADRMLQLTSLSFDVSIWELFTPLIAGATLVAAAPGSQRDPRYLVDLIQEQGITLAGFVPSLLRVFLEEPGAPACTSLRYLISGGEALSAALQARFFAGLSAALYNFYGPTECCIDTTYWECRSDALQTTVPIGFPVAGARLYLLNPDLSPVVPGEPGELYVGGIGVARGYFQRPALTAAQFLPDPFSTDPGARMYRTGDLVRTLADGSLEFLGRVDRQVKVRGFRIELGEIESRLREHPAVQEAVVLARPVTAAPDSNPVISDATDDTALLAHILTYPPDQIDRRLREIEAEREP